MCSENIHPAMNRKNFLRLSGAGLAGAVLLGNAGGRVLAQTGSSLQAGFESAAQEYQVPVELLMAMAYVNTLWEMPSPGTTPYREGDIHGRGAYGIMQLMQNPYEDTLGRAASLTGLTEEELKRNRAANVRGGAAILAELQGSQRSTDLNAWQEAVAEYVDTDLYAHDVYEILQNGASATISTGERLELPAQENVEVPRVFTAQGKRGYRKAIWRPAHRGSYSNRSRGAKQIDVIVAHVAEGSFAGTINWFQTPRPQSPSSAHYVVARNGRIAQCVRDEDIAWHAGHWGYNRRSIGIEHEGYGSQPGKWFTPQMYRASAKLAAWLSRRYGIPVNKRHVIPHRKASATACPGKFDLDKYRRTIRKFR
jgi:hypothetical protein